MRNGDLQLQRRAQVAKTEVGEIVPRKNKKILRQRLARVSPSCFSPLKCSIICSDLWIWMPPALGRNSRACRRYCNHTRSLSSISSTSFANGWARTLHFRMNSDCHECRRHIDTLTNRRIRAKMESHQVLHTLTLIVAAFYLTYSNQGWFLDG